MLWALRNEQGDDDREEVEDVELWKVDRLG